MSQLDLSSRDVGRVDRSGIWKVEELTCKNFKIEIKIKVYNLITE